MAILSTVQFRSDWVHTYTDEDGAEHKEWSNQACLDNGKVIKYRISIR